MAGELWTLRWYADYWLETVARARLRPVTRRNSSCAVRVHIGPGLGTVRLRSLTLLLMVMFRWPVPPGLISQMSSAPWLADQLAVRPPLRQLVLDSGVVGELPLVPAPAGPWSTAGIVRSELLRRKTMRRPLPTRLPRMSNAMP